MPTCGLRAGADVDARLSRGPSRLPRAYLDEKKTIYQDFILDRKLYL